MGISPSARARGVTGVYPVPGIGLCPDNEKDKKTAHRPAQKAILITGSFSRPSEAVLPKVLLSDKLLCIFSPVRTNFQDIYSLGYILQIKTLYTFADKTSYLLERFSR